MLIKKGHWLFKERFNKNNSNHYKDFTPYQIDNFINAGQDLLIEDIFGDSQNVINFERDQQKTDILSKFVVTHEPTLPVLQVTSTLYKVDLTDLKQDYLHKIRAWVETECGLVKVIFVQHDDLSYILEDQFSKPSKKWRRIIGVFSNGFIELHSEVGFKLSKLKFTYIRKPNTVFYGGYDTIEYDNCVQTNGTNCNIYLSTSSNPVNIEFEHPYDNLVIDYAIREASRTLEIDKKLQLLNNKIESTIR